jgi:hypothetical protein
MILILNLLLLWRESFSYRSNCAALSMRDKWEKSLVTLLIASTYMP